MRTHRRILHFLALTARDVLLPDFIAIPLALAQNFYGCFLCVDPREKLELLKEARALSDAEVEQLIDALADGWRAVLPGGKLAAKQRDAVRRLVLVLRGADPARDPDAEVQGSLGGVLFPGRAFVPPTHRPEQVAVGRTLLLAALRGMWTERPGPRPLPKDAPLIPGHDLCHVIGEGGFSVVYLARHADSGQRRAVKVGPLDDAKRFAREVAMLQSLSGPHVVRYHEHGELGARFWISMDYLGEHTLTDLILARPDAEQALLLAAQLLRGLAALHAAGIVHRDLKPDNAMVDAHFTLRLIDFGLSRPVAGFGARTVSMTSGILGTPRYVSPEQINEDRITLATDLWAFGCVLFELFAGAPLFPETRIGKLFDQIKHEPLPSLDRPEVPPEMRPFLVRCLEREPARRWPDARAAEQAFTAAMTPARKRLRHERYRGGWERILQSRLLERFVEQEYGVALDQATRRLAVMARGEGIDAIDEERIGEVLPPLFAAQREVMSAAEAVRQAKQRLQAEVASLLAEQMVARVEQIRALEQAEQTRKAEVGAKAAELLKEERASWEERLREGQEQRERAERERRAQEVAERQRLANEEAERQRRAQEEADRQRRAKEQAEREHQRLEEQRRQQQQLRARRREQFWEEWGGSIGLGVLTVLGFVALGAFLGAAAGGQWLSLTHTQPSQIPVQRAVVDASWPILLLFGVVVVVTGTWLVYRRHYSTPEMKLLRSLVALSSVGGCVTGFAGLLHEYKAGERSFCGFYCLSCLAFLTGALLLILVVKFEDMKRVSIALLAFPPVVACMVVVAGVLGLLLLLLLWVLALPASLIVDSLAGAGQGGLVVGLSFGLWGVAVGFIVCLISKAHR